MSRIILKTASGDDRFPAIIRYFREQRDNPALKRPEEMKSHLRLFNDLYCVPKFESESDFRQIDDLVDNPQKYVEAQVAVAAAGPTYVEETPTNKALNEEDYRIPAECLEGDLLCDLTHELTNATFIPPQFAHADLQVWTGHVLDGRVVPPNSAFLDFSTRFYVNKFSYHPETGKGEAWKRVVWSFADTMQPRPIEAAVKPEDVYAPIVTNGTNWGSGPFMVKELSETPNCIGHLDEGASLWQGKADTDRKSIEAVLLTLFDSHGYGTGSFKNKKHVASNVHLSFNACFTLDSFTQAYQGRGSGGSGFLSRVVLVFGTKIPTNGQVWPLLEHTKARSIATEITGIMANPKSLSTTPEAAKLTSDFKKWLEKEDQHFVSRIAYYFDKDAALRATFKDGVVTPEIVRRSIRWAQEQLNLRKRFWPIDSASPQGILEFKILSEFETSDTLRSDRQLQDSLRIGRRDGKFNAQQYNWAREALLKSGQLERAGYNRKGNGIYKRRSQ